MEIKLSPVAFVFNSRKEPIDDHWEEIISEIRLVDNIPSESLAGLQNFSHLEIIYHFNKVKPESIVFSGKPRGIETYPLMGIFGQRKKDRPNALGLCTVQLLSVSERSIKVKFLDAIDGTPVLDIKPVFTEFLPKGNVQEPGWVKDLMKAYW